MVKTVLSILSVASFAIVSAACAATVAQEESPAPAAPVSKEDQAKAKQIEQAMEDFKRMDANGDGVVSRDELIAEMLKQNPTVTAIPDALVDQAMTMFDVDKDGQISRYEMALVHSNTPSDTAPPADCVNCDPDTDEKEKSDSEKSQ